MFILSHQTPVYILQLDTIVDLLLYYYEAQIRLKHGFNLVTYDGVDGRWGRRGQSRPIQITSF